MKSTIGLSFIVLALSACSSLPPSSDSPVVVFGQSAERSGPEKSSSRISGISASMSDGSRRSTGAENNEKTSP